MDAEAERPPCPKCHSLEIIGWGTSWKCKSCGRRFEKLGEYAREQFVNPATTRLYTDFWKLEWDEFIVCCDTHSPHAQSLMYDRLFQIADRYGVKNFLHAGDFFDGNTFSKWSVEPEDMVPWHQEIEYSKQLLKEITKHFEDARFIMGSHDVRFQVNLLSQGKCVDFDSPYQMCGVEGIKTSRYRYAEINHEWRINHPKNTVKIGGLPSIRLSAKHGRSIVFGHGHWWGINRDPSGKHYLCAPGCMCDAQRIGYKNLWDTSHDEWVEGFLLVTEKTKPILFSRDSPWGIYLK